MCEVWDMRASGGSVKLPRGCIGNMGKDNMEGNDNIGQGLGNLHSCSHGIVLRPFRDGGSTAKCRSHE